jgi:phosphate transport system substrate-binding protein
LRLVHQCSGIQDETAAVRSPNPDSACPTEVKEPEILQPARLLGALGVAAALAATAPAVAAAKPTITVSGSTSVAPLTRELFKGYLKAKPGSVKFVLLQGGSDVGINDVARGRVPIGASSRDPKPTDPGGLTFSRIARDGVCVVTNPDNPVPNLSQEQIQNIFAGRIRSWSDVPGATATGTIDLVTRTAASGTQDAFQNIFMGPDLNISSSASQQSTNGTAQNAIRSNENAIGYLDFDFTEGTHPVSYKGVACNLRNAKSGTYGGVRNFFYVTRGAPKGASKKFIDWVRNSKPAKRIVASNWVPR